MNAVTTVICSAPPPTFNTLDSRQRSRLIRSTRKLGQVLGTTPHLLEDSSHISSALPIARNPLPSSRYDRKRRQGSIFEFTPPTAPFTYDCASASSSLSSLALPRSSLESTDSDISARSLPILPAPKSFAKHVRDKSRTKGKRAPLPSPLVLRLNAVPLPPSDPRVHLPVTPDTAATLKSATTTPISSASTMPLTPSTPQTPITPTAAETRRKRLAKLKRTLGENIPQELILPFRTRTPHRSPTPTDSSPSPPLTKASPLQSSRTQPPAQLSSTMPALRATKGPRRRSLSVDFAHGAPALVAAANLSSGPPSPSARRQPASHTASFPETEAQERRSSRVWVTGTATWTGEWNRKDIREVQHRLRTLKVR